MQLPSPLPPRREGSCCVCVTTVPCRLGLVLRLISFLGVSCLSSLAWRTTGLRTLSLRQNLLTDAAPISSLRCAPVLRELVLHDNQLTEVWPFRRPEEARRLDGDAALPSSTRSALVTQ